jgi:hypothetical protein
MWSGHRFVNTATTRILRMRAPPMGTMARPGLWMACSSARARGITDGAVDTTAADIMDADTTDADTTAAGRSSDAVSKAVVLKAVVSNGVVSKGVGRPQGSTVADRVAVNPTAVDRAVLAGRAADAGNEFQT